MNLYLRIVLYLFLITQLQPMLCAQTEPEMIFVNGGTFKMGDKNGDHDEYPVHTVTLSSFYISKHEITIKQYKEYCADTGVKMPKSPSKEWQLEHDEAKNWTWKDENPITNITWNDAVMYCKWLSKKKGKNYTLPTEAQWEFAAKGGVKSKKYKYSGSNNINDVAWYDETSNERGPMPVGKLKPNELGIYDMSGNAWEWCLDYYGKYNSSKKKNPKGPEKGLYKVVRGGSWYYVGRLAVVTARDGPYIHYTNYNYGFRPVINP